jgi:exopolyphosphatase/guanosine-5'-triphosphate,3'-diphosphate pyrophosphatase
MAWMRIAVFDLGSTTFQLLVTEADEDGTLTPILRDRVILNLGMVLSAADGRIPPSAGARAIDTVRRFRDVALRAGAERILPIATSALRDAGNREELAAVLGEAAGDPIRFIDGREEARLVFAGVRASVAIGAGPTLLLDLGGGSLEVAVADEAGLRWGETLPLGAGRMTAQVLRTDPPSRKQLREITRMVEEGVVPLVELAGRGGAPVRCVVSGGTTGALARILAARRWGDPPPSLNQWSVGLDEVRELGRELSALDLDGRLKIDGVDERRADLLPAGAVVVTTAVAAFGLPSMLVSEFGLREGAVLDALGLGAGPGLTPEELRRRSVERLAHVWGEDPAHVSLIAGLATRLFDATREAHRLGEVERELLSHAALLHDIGVRVSPDRHHKHGAYLVEHADLKGFTPDEIALMASLVRFQKGRDPRPSYPPFARLPASLRERCAVLAGLLRVVHALGRGGEHDAREVVVTVRGADVLVSVAGTSNPEAAVAEAGGVADLLERSLGVELRFEAELLGRASA